MLSRVLASASFAALLGCASAEETPNLVYDDRFGDATKLDVYRPAAAAARPRPAVLLFHGGLWDGHDKSDYAPTAKRLAASGWVAISANYRVMPKAGYPAAIQDAQCALAYVRNHADELGVDPGRIAVGGFSSGAHLASMLGVATGVRELEPDCKEGATSAPRAVIGSSGIYELDLNPKDGKIKDFLGGTIDEVPERWALASPASHVGPRSAPHLLVHSDFDFVVSGDQTVKMIAKLTLAGVASRDLLLFDEGHFLASGADVGGLYYGTIDDRTELWIAMTDFLDDTLGPP